MLQYAANYKAKFYSTKGHLLHCDLMEIKNPLQKDKKQL